MYLKGFSATKIRRRYSIVNTVKQKSSKEFNIEVSREPLSGRVSRETAKRERKINI